MPEPDRSSARIFASLVQGSDVAADELFHRYLNRLSQLARNRLASRLARRIDPEDVVMSAYRSFFVAARAGRFTIERSGDLWALLTTITLRKLYRTVAHHSAEKRDITREVCAGDSFDLNRWASSREPDAEEAVALSDEVEWLLNSLSTTDRRILELRLQGELIEDIALEAAVSERTVRRALAKIQEGLVAKNGDFLPELSANRPSESRIHGAARSVSALAMKSQAISIPFDQIRLQKLIGRGGMGKVYRAVRRETQKQIAVKFLHKSFQSNSEMVRRFLEEATIIEQLHHPGIVGMHGTGVTSAGVYFIVMELIDGISLDELPSRPDTSTIVEWTIELADALQHAHVANIVHCDLKPSNVMIGRDGHPVITDFGLARTLHNSETMAMAGTAPWMAPEQVDTSFGRISVRTDVYGLGALFYTLLTGQSPFPGTRAADIFCRIISAQRPVAPSQLTDGIPDSIEQICLQCLEKQPAARPESMAEVLWKLKRSIVRHT